MIIAEIIAFKAGVQTALDHALRVAAALEAVPAWKPTRVPFAAAALGEFAEAGKMLLIPPPPGCGESAGVNPASPTPNPAGEEMPNSPPEKAIAP